MGRKNMPEGWIITVRPDGTFTEKYVKGAVGIETLHEEIGCDRVDYVALTNVLDMWLDDEGMINGSQVNELATFIAYLYGLTHQAYFGTAVIAGHDREGETIGLSLLQANAVRRFLDARA